VIVAVSNDGVAGVPACCAYSSKAFDGKIQMSGSLDAGHPYAAKTRQASFLYRKQRRHEIKDSREIETKNG
jgi:hypothetical protein